MKCIARVIIVLLICIMPLSAGANPCASDRSFPSPFTEKWSSLALGTGVGLSGIHSFDSNGNGIPELIFGSGKTEAGPNSSFRVIEYNSSTGSFEFLCQSEHYQYEIQTITAFDNERIEYGSLISHGEFITVIDHQRGTKDRIIPTGLETINDLAIGDADNDGTIEIIAVSDNSMILYDATNYRYKTTLPHGSQNLAIGNISSRNKTQIVTDTGLLLEFSDGNVSVDRLWDESLRSPKFLESGDVDNDGYDEIIAAQNTYDMRVYNGEDKTLAWEIRTGDWINAVGIHDVTGDNTPEIMYVDRQHGSVHALNGTTGNAVWSVENPDAGAAGIFAGNLDNDSGIEVAWGAGFGSNTSDYLYIYDTGTSEFEWKSPPSQRDFMSAVEFGDLNADGVPDRISAMFKTHRGDGIITAIDGATDKILWQTTDSTFGKDTYTGLHDIVIADIDGDTINEVLVASDDGYFGAVYILDNASGQLKNKVLLENGSPVYSLIVTDIDGDRDMEILAGGGREHTGANGIFIYVIDGSTLSWVDTSPDIDDGSWDDVWIMGYTDLGNNGSKKIVTIYSRQVRILDLTGRTVLTLSGNYWSMATTTDEDTGQEITYLGDGAGNLSILSEDASASVVANLCGGPISGLAPITSDKLAFTCANELATYNISADEVTWLTDKYYGAYLGALDRIAVERIQGKLQIFTGGERAYLFEEDEFSALNRPIAVDANYTGHFNDPITGTVFASVSNQSEITYGIHQDPHTGFVTIDNSTGNFIYTPGGKYAGIDRFEFFARADNRLFSTATINLDLTNSPPQTGVQRQDVHWQGKHQFTINATDLEGDEVTYEIVEPPLIGKLTLLNANTGLVSYENPKYDRLSESFKFSVSDAIDSSDDKIFYITHTNTIPEVQNIEVARFLNTSIEVQLGGYDADGDTLVDFDIRSDLPNNQYTINEAGILTYFPQQQGTHVATFSYWAYDGRDWSEPAEARLTIRSLSDTSNVVIEQFSAERQLVDSRLTIQFMSRASGGTGAYTYSWDLGDGQFSSERTPRHLYADGTHRVVLRVRDEANPSNCAARKLLININGNSSTIQNFPGDDSTCTSVNWDNSIQFINSPDSSTDTTLPQTPEHNANTDKHRNASGGTGSISVLLLFLIISVIFDSRRKHPLKRSF
jgi:hypothetical protein